MDTRGCLNCKLQFENLTWTRDRGARIADHLAYRLLRSVRPFCAPFQFRRNCSCEITSSFEYIGSRHNALIHPAAGYAVPAKPGRYMKRHNFKIKLVLLNE